MNTNKCSKISKDLNCQSYDELKDDVFNATSFCKRTVMTFSMHVYLYNQNQHCIAHVDCRK